MEPRADEREPCAEGATASSPPKAAKARAEEEPQVPRETAPPKAGDEKEASGTESAR